MKKLLSTVLLAALCLALPAAAQVQASLNDLILGFRATGGQGQNINLEVNLGSASQFQNLSAGATLLISRLSAADLAAAYGSNWASRTDLFWGVVGTAGRVSGGPNGAPIATLWATRAQETVGTQSLPWTPGSRNAQTNASSGIEALLFGAPGSLNGATSTSLSSSSAEINATLAGSYTVQDSFQSGTSFGFFNPSVNNFAKAPSGDYAVSDLYELRVDGASGTYLGSFGLSTSGTLTFSTSSAFFTGSSGAPIITTQPNAQAVVLGGNATFSVTATGTGTLSYQWYKDGVAIGGATASTLTLSGVTAASAGSYSITVGNSSGSITSTGILLTVGSVPNPGRLINLSVLTSVAAGNNFTFGFVVGGTGTSGNKPLLMRAAGPSLAQFGVGGVLADPFMEYFSGSNKVTENNDWSGDSGVLATSAAVGAFPYTATTSKDAAIYLSNVSFGANSVRVSGVGTNAGAVIAELYDATPSAQFNSNTPRLINVSVLKDIGSSITVGFVVGGSTNVKVLVRAIGPSLTAFGVGGVISDPKLTLFNGAGTALATNDDWAGTAALTAAFSQVGAFALTATSKDAAVLQTLSPGSYTLQVTPSTGSTGVALVEVYEVP